MAAYLRRGLTAGIAAALLLVCGCSAANIAYMLFGDTGLNAECEVFQSPKKEIKVVFLTFVDSDMKHEFLRMDRELSEALTRLLKKRYEESKDKIKIVAPGLVESFKDKNLNWHTMSIREIGDYFHADYVVNVELDHLSLYELNSNSEFFRGLAQARVTVHDPKTGEGPFFTKDYTFKYPTHGPQSVFDTTNPSQFRSEFLAFVVKQMARCFAKFPIEDKYPCE